MFKQWVDSRVPIFLEILKNPSKPASPFKLCSAWLKNEEVIQIIQDNWIPFQVEEGSRETVHFYQNLARLKKNLKEWALNKKTQDDQALLQIETELEELQSAEGGGFLNQGDKEKLFSLESNRNRILKEREQVLRLKRCAIWIECGDDNTKLFQAFAKGRKQQNTIWELKKANNETSTSFEYLAGTGKDFFENLFKANQQASIAEVIHLSQLFPESITKEDNLDLMEEISEEELKATPNSFQKEKIPGLDGWTVLNF